MNGTITIINPTSGATVASATVQTDQLATIHLVPGTYTIEDEIRDPTAMPDDEPTIMLSPQTVTIPAGKTVRQDCIDNVDHHYNPVSG